MANSVRQFLFAAVYFFASYSSAAALTSSVGPKKTTIIMGRQKCANVFVSRRVLSHRPQLKIRGGNQEIEIHDRGAELESEAEATAASTNTASLFIPCKLIATLATIGRFYSNQLELRPILTKSYTAGLIFGLSDYFAQKLEGSNDVNNSGSRIDRVRVMVSILVGMCYFGPAAHYWYEWIFKLLPSTSLASTLYKAFWGQLLFGPSFTCIFFASSLIQSGDFTMGTWWNKIRNDLPKAWLGGVFYWPIVDLISYSLIPIKLIPLFVNMASFVWTIYLSLVANKGMSTSSASS